MPTIPQTQSILQSYLRTGLVPTQDQWTELIGTMFYLYNVQLNAANNAVAIAEAAAATALSNPSVFMRATFPSGGAFVADVASVGISSATLLSSGSGTSTFRITFFTAFSAVPNYVMLNKSPGTTGTPSAATPTTTHVDITVDTASAGGFMLSIYP